MPRHNFFFLRVRISFFPSPFFFILGKKVVKRIIDYVGSDQDDGRLVFFSLSQFYVTVSFYELFPRVTNYPFFFLFSSPPSHLATMTNHRSHHQKLKKFPKVEEGDGTKEILYFCLTIMGQLKVFKKEPIFHFYLLICFLFV